MPTVRSPVSRPFGPQLMPGALLLRRDARTLQIGTSPGVLVRDRPGLGRILRLLDGSIPLPHLTRLVAREIPEFTDDLGQTLTRLIAAGVVVPPPPEPVPDVAVRHDRSTAEFAALLSPAFGLGAIDPGIEVLVSAGEPARSTFEVLVAAGVPHLPVVLDERRVRIGPFVVPGATPCLGCLDALTASADPGWAALVPQFERPRLLPVALPQEILLRAAAEAIRQVDAFRTGRRPRTVGRTLSFGVDHRDAEPRDVPFAHDCHCNLLAA